METNLNKHAPIKKRIMRGNNQPHVTKSLRKAVSRSKIKNIANKTNCHSDLFKL